MAFLDFLRPDWKHSSADVRLDAIHKLGEKDTEALLELVRQDPDGRVRLAALERIKSPNLLLDLRKEDLEADVLHALQVRVNAMLKAQAMSAHDSSQAAGSLQRIDDENVLAEIAFEAENADLRLAAVRLIRHEATLCKVVAHNCGKQVAEEVVSRIQGEEHLREVSRNGGNKHARRLADNRLAAIDAERNKPTQEQIRREKLDAILAQAEQFRESWNWDYVNEQYQALDQQWRRLDPDLREDGRATFDAAREHFQGRWDAFMERLAAEQQAAAERAARIQFAEAICERLEAALTDTEADAPALIAEAEAEWQLQPPAKPEVAEGEEAPEPPADDPEEKALRARFRHVCGQLRAAAEWREREIAVMAELHELADSAEAALAEGKVAEAEKAAARLAARLAKTSFKVLTPPEGLAERAAAVRATVEGRREELEAAERAAKAELLAKREALCVEIEGLIEAEERIPAANRVKELQAAWKELPKPDDEQSEGLHRRFRAAANAFFDQQREFHEEEDWQRWANKTLKEELCAKVELIARIDDLPLVAKLVQEAQKRWKAIGPVPRADSQPLWERFHNACEAQYGRAKEFFEEQQAEREASLKIKEGLVEEAEKHQDSEDWRGGAEIFKSLQAQWKEAGPGPRKAEEALWERFRAAGNRYFERRRAHFEELDKERQENLGDKQPLVERVEALVAEPNWQNAREIRELQAQWKEIGPAPRNEEQALWERFRAACDKFFAWVDEQRPANQAAKEAICTEVEGLLAELTDESNKGAVARQIIDAQKRWKALGPGDQKAEDAVWKRFHKLCDAFFQKRQEERAEDDRTRQGNLEMKQELLAQAEALEDSDDWRETAEELKQLQDRFKSVGYGPRDEDREVTRKFWDTCDKFFTRRRDFFASRDQERQDNLGRKEALCAELESILGLDGNAEAPAEGAPAPKQNKVLNLAEELSVAFETNFIFGGAAPEQQRVTEEVQRIQQEWRYIGPVPREDIDRIRARYRRALDAYYGD